MMKTEGQKDKGKIHFAIFRDGRMAFFYSRLIAINRDKARQGLSRRRLGGEGFPAISRQDSRQVFTGRVIARNSGVA